MRLKFLPAVLVSLIIAGCGGDGGQNVIKNPNKPAIAAVNASPDAPALDFRLNDKVFGSGLSYLASPSPFYSFDKGDYDLTSRASAGGSDFDDQVITASDGQDFVAVALGLQNYADEPLKRLRIASFNVDRVVPNGNKARVIVVNAFLRASGFEPTSIDFQDGDVPQFALSAIEYGGQNSVVVDAGSIKFQARRAGTELVYVEQPFTFESGKVYLAVVSGIEGETGTKAPKITFLSLPTKASS